MTELAEAVLAGATGGQLLDCAVPTRYRAAHLLAEQANMFRDRPEEADRDVRESIHVDEVPLPELAPDEVLIAVMASAINYNTVWSAMFEPVPTFAFLDRLGRQGWWGKRHDLPYHVIGSDAAGVVVRTGPGVRRWSAGDRAVVFPVQIDDQEPASQEDAIVSSGQRAWGFETNFGGLADFAVVKASQLLPKPRHLSWEEAACNTLCACTAYRMLVSPHGATMKQGDIVFVWGATGGLGGYAVQLVKNGGGIPVGIVSSPAKEAALRELGCDAVINRAELGLDLECGDVKSWRKLGEEIRRQVGEDPHIVFEHTGRATFGASVYVTRRGGAVVSCGSSSGYLHEFDNRYLWMRLKRIIGSHGSNYQESSEVNRLLSLGMLVPALSRVYSLNDVGEAVRGVQRNEHLGKVGVRCLAPRDGLGIEDRELRERIGEDRLQLFRRHS